MSLIGPRPFCRKISHLILAAAFGSSRPDGMAQVNGGKRLTAEEKDKLDEWYIRNASIWPIAHHPANAGLVLGGGRSKRAQSMCSRLQSLCKIQLRRRGSKPRRSVWNRLSAGCRRRERRRATGGLNSVKCGTIGEDRTNFRLSI